ncbi:hypothetical protein [Streptomyces sp. NPDC001492]
MNDTTSTTGTATLLTEIAQLAQQLWMPGVTHLSLQLPVRGYLGIHGVRAAGTGWVPVAAQRYAPVDGSRLRLAELLAELTTQDPECPALAMEEGHRARLALYPVPGQREDAAQLAYAAAAVLTDPEEQRARNGAQLVGEFLRRNDAFGDSDQVHHGAALAALHRQLNEGGRSAEPAAMLAAAVGDVLHHADGWWGPEDVLTRAFGLYWKSPRPYAENVRVPAPEYGTNTRGLDALAGTVACLYAVADTVHGIADNDLADRAEQTFTEEIEAARWATVRAARSRQTAGR